MSQRLGERAARCLRAAGRRLQAQGQHVPHGPGQQGLRALPLVGATGRSRPSRANGLGQGRPSLTLCTASRRGSTNTAAASPARRPARPRSRGPGSAWPISFPLVIPDDVTSGRSAIRTIPSAIAPSAAGSRSRHGLLGPACGRAPPAPAAIPITARAEEAFRVASRPRDQLTGQVHEADHLEEARQHQQGRPMQGGHRHDRESVRPKQLRGALGEAVRSRPETAPGWPADPRRKGPTGLFWAFKALLTSPESLAQLYPLSRAGFSRFGKALEGHPRNGAQQAIAAISRVAVDHGPV